MSNFCANGIFHVILTFITFNKVHLLALPDIRMESYLDLNRLRRCSISIILFCLKKMLFKMTDKLHKWENCKFNNPPTQKQYNSRIATKENEVLHLSFLESSTVRSFLCLFSINITCHFFLQCFNKRQPEDNLMVTSSMVLRDKVLTWTSAYLIISK